MPTITTLANHLLRRPERIPLIELLRKIRQLLARGIESPGFSGIF
jgi:hypothetical protein